MASAARSHSRTDFLLLIACVVLSVIALALPSSSRDPIAGALRTTVVAPLVGLQHGAQRWRTAWASREAELSVRDSLALSAIEGRALQSENEQLRKVIGLARRLGTGFIPAEALQTSDMGDVVTTVLLSAGSNAGVRRYSPVVSPDGLVGAVQTADPTMSVAMLYTSPDFRASAITTDGAAFGLVYPHLGSRTMNRERLYMLELRGVPYRIKLAVGTEIVTAGVGGTFPRGIPIGTVVDTLESVEGLARTYLLAPAVNPSRVTAVLILTPQRTAQGVGNVWTSAVAMDSATRRILAAGDSLAKVASDLELRAKLAAIDSGKRAAVDSLLSVLRARGISTGPLDSAARAAAALPPLAPGAGGRAATAVLTPAQQAFRDSIRRVRDSTRRDSVRRDSIRRATGDTTHPVQTSPRMPHGGVRR